MEDYVIKESTIQECKAVEKGIIEYNLSKAPFTQDPLFESVNRVIKDSNDVVIAGINCLMYCWNCMFIDILWVKEEFRKNGYGSILLKEIEKIAKEKGCHLIHLYTFDFQAKDFYLKHGYEIFGILDDCPEGHKEYYLKKNIQ